MSSSSGAEEALITSPLEQQANAPAATTTMDANQQQADAAACAEKRLSQPRQRNMDPHMLALASSGSLEKLQALLNGEDSQASGHGGTDGTRRASSYACDDDTEANESILAGVTAEGDTALHVVAAYGQGDNFVIRIRLWCGGPKDLRDYANRFHIRGAGERHPLARFGYGDGDDFCDSADIIYGKAKHLLFAQNNNGDTPLHCAARAGKSNMVERLIRLARGEGQGRVTELLRKENKHKETALHQAVRVGNKDIVERLMEEDTELAGFPQDGGVSPIYLAIVLEEGSIQATLYAKSHTKLSFSGPNGQNALHAAVLRDTGYTKLLELNKTHLCLQNKDLTTQRDENGSTPLHFAAAIKFPFQSGPSSVCGQVLEANPDALYQAQADHAGFFPIHVAASVGAVGNVKMFVDNFPGTAGLRDAKGRTFLHVAVEKKNVEVIRSACGRDLTQSWIMNMVDNDGNTALHLAVEVGSLQMFCSLLGNPQVNFNLPNKRGETPFDIADYKFPEEGLFSGLNSERVIFQTLLFAGAVKGVRRQDHFEDDKAVRLKHNKSKEMEVLKDSTGAVCIGSVLIASVTFGATFAVPGGYIADDHNNGGSPILARRYAFEAFIASNSLAFVSSMVATIALMLSGNPLVNPRRRKTHYFAASYFLSMSITCLAAAFALGAYVVLAPVSHKTAVATCVLSCLVLLYTYLELIGKYLLLPLPPLFKRKGFILAWVYSATMIVLGVLIGYWPLIFIFGWAVHANSIQK